MILDSRLEFADAVALSTAGTGLRLVAGSQVDTGAVERDFGVSDSLWFVVQVDTAVAGTSSTVSFILASDASAAIAIDGSATIHYESAAIAEAALVAGYQIAVKMPMELPVYERYLGVLIRVGVAALAAGKINAFLTHDVSRLKHYNDGI